MCVSKHRRQRGRLVRRIRRVGITDQKRQIGFEASCDGGSVARSPRSVLVCVSRHRRQRAASVRRIGSEMLLLVGHPGLEPGANGL
jgi:hypothetical protein